MHDLLRQDLLRLLRRFGISVAIAFMAGAGVGCDGLDPAALAFWGPAAARYARTVSGSSSSTWGPASSTLGNSPSSPSGGWGPGSEGLASSSSSGESSYSPPSSSNTRQQICELIAECGSSSGGMEACMSQLARLSGSLLDTIASCLEGLSCQEIAQRFQQCLYGGDYSPPPTGSYGLAEGSDAGVPAQP